MWPYLVIISTALIAFITWFIDKKLHITFKVLMTVLMIVTLTGQIIAINDDNQRQEAARYSGVLQDRSTILLAPGETMYPKLKLGDSETYFYWQGDAGQSLISYLTSNDLSIAINNGQLQLSTKIRDSHGNLIAEITNNEWTLNKDKLWDRNFDKQALEVKDATGDVVLQVQLKDDYIQLAAKMYDQNGSGLGIGSSIFTQEDIVKHQQGESKIVALANGPQEVHVGEVTGVLEVRPSGVPLQLHINPLFRYPSDLHLHERVR